jgi:hypothetical protein
MLFNMQKKYIVCTFYFLFRKFGCEPLSKFELNCFRVLPFATLSNDLAFFLFCSTSTRGSLLEYTGDLLCFAEIRVVVGKKATNRLSYGAA